jgi:hypothetical protein
MLYRVVGYKRYGTLTFYSDSRSLLFLALITANKTNMKSPTLENTEGAIINGQSRETGNI